MKFKRRKKPLKKLLIVPGKEGWGERTKWLIKKIVKKINSEISKSKKRKKSEKKHSEIYSEITRKLNETKFRRKTNVRKI